jgi:hypothetical protein
MHTELRLLRLRCWEIVCYDLVLEKDHVEICVRICLAQMLDIFWMWNRKRQLTSRMNVLANLLALRRQMWQQCQLYLHRKRMSYRVNVNSTELCQIFFHLKYHLVQISQIKLHQKRFVPNFLFTWNCVCLSATMKMMFWKKNYANLVFDFLGKLRIKYVYLIQLSRATSSVS